MTTPNSLTCYHCGAPGHWKDTCQLLRPPAVKGVHDARIAAAVRRFTSLQIGPVTKQRIIRKEKELWRKRQKEMARK